MLSRTARSLLTNKRTFKINSLPVRAFGQAPNWYDNKAPNGLAAVTPQPDGKDPGHHEHIHAVGLDHKFIAANANKKTVVFDNLHGSSNAVAALDNQFAHLNGLSMFHHEYIFSPYSHANLIVNEPNTHDEPYGYEFGDDPFDTHGHGDMPFLVLFVGLTAFVTTLAQHFRFDKRKTSEVLYHQRLTAFQIEDELVKMRK